MESIGTCSLVLDNDYILDLERTCYILVFLKAKAQREAFFRVNEARCKPQSIEA